VTRGTSAATQAGHTQRRSTWFGEIGLPETVENWSHRLESRHLDAARGIDGKISPLHA
jgi:hypothetical protein